MIAELIPFFPHKNNTSCSCCQINLQTNVIIDFSSVPVEHNINGISSLPEVNYRYTDVNSDQASNYSIALDRIKNNFDQDCIEDKSQSSAKNDEIIDFPIGRFMRFLKYIKLNNLLASITDPRYLKKTTHKVEIVLQWVLAVFFSV